MTDYVENMIELKRLKKLLKHGDKRELARRMGVTPVKIANAYDGFTKDSNFLKSLAAETRKLIAEPVTASERD